MKVTIPGTNHVALAADQYITPQCLKEGRLDWDRSFLDIPEVNAVLKPGNVVFDVGAYIGDTTRLFLNQGCTVYAFEPYLDAYDCLKQNCPDAKCINAVVGESGQAVTARPPEDSLANLGGRGVIKDAGSKIQSIPLDHFVDLIPRLDFLKIDVEGFEPHVLKGGLKLIHKFRPVIMMEINPPALRLNGFDWRSVTAPIEADGYRIRVVRFPERQGSEMPWDVMGLPT